MRPLLGTLLAVGVCLILVGALQAQNYVCIFYRSPSDGNDQYLLAETGAIMRGTWAIFEDAACQTQTAAVDAGSRGWAYASTRAAAEAICRADVAQLSASSNRSLWRCLAEARRSRKLSSNLRRPARPTGETLMQGSLLRLYAVDGIDSGIHYQRVREAGIGQPAIIGLGWLDAIDVWGDVGAGYKVCFPQAGRTIFLDAAYTPRLPLDLPFETDDGYTCVSLDRAGTIVLVKDPDAAVDASEPIALAGCTVTTVTNLYLRDRPEGTVQTRQAPATTSTASWSRTAWLVRYRV